MVQVLPPKPEIAVLKNAYFKICGKEKLGYNNIPTPPLAQLYVWK